MKNEDYDVVEILNAIGVERVSEKGDEVNFSCPQDYHSRGDRNPSANINKKTLAYHCFSCKSKGNLFTLVADVEGVSVAVAIKWLQDKYYLGDITEDQQRSAKQIIENMLNKKDQPDELPKWISEDALNNFGVDWDKAYEAYRNGTLNNGLERPFEKYDLTVDTVKQFQLGYDKISKRITIPIRDSKSNLVSIKGRSCSNDDPPKYLGLGDKDGKTVYGFPRINNKSLVFGLDTATPDLIICEGEFDAMSLRQKGFGGAVAAGTCDVTEEQVKELIKKGEKAIILFDPDDAGISGAEKVSHLLLPSMPVRIGRLDKNDPATTIQKELEDILSKSEIPKVTKEN
jgi:DNA primase